MGSTKAEFKNELKWIEMQIEHLTSKAEQQLLYSLEWEEYEQKCEEEITRLKHEMINSDIDSATDLVFYNKRIQELNKRECDAMLSSQYYKKKAYEYSYLVEKYEKQRNKMIEDYSINFGKQIELKIKNSANEKEYTVKGYSISTPIEILSFIKEDE